MDSVISFLLFKNFNLPFYFFFLIRFLNFSKFFTEDRVKIHFQIFFHSFSIFIFKIPSISSSQLKLNNLSWRFYKTYCQISCINNNEGRKLPLPHKIRRIAGKEVMKSWQSFKDLGMWALVSLTGIVKRRYIKTRETQIQSLPRYILYPPIAI